MMLSTVLALSSLIYVALAAPADDALRPGASLQNSWLHRCAFLSTFRQLKSARSERNRERLYEMSILRERLMKMLNAYFAKQGVKIDEKELQQGCALVHYQSAQKTPSLYSIDAFIAKPAATKRFDQEDFGLRFGKRAGRSSNEDIDVALRWGRR